MAKRDFFHTGLQVGRSEMQSLKDGAKSFGESYYVSRNVGTSGDGLSRVDAFKTIGEAIAAVNLAFSTAAFPTRGRNTRIIIDEGFYSEVPLTLTASDCHIIAQAPGNHDSTVLYGSATAGGFDIGAGGPALTVTGSNCTIEGLGGFTHDVLFAAFQNGVVSGATTGNAFINCGAIRDVADGCLGGILDYGADGTLIDNFFASTSCKDFGVRSKTDGVINPVNLEVRGGNFVGTPIGVDIEDGHNAQITGNDFVDDTSDRPDVVDFPIVVAAGASAFCSRNTSALTKAAIVTGAGTIVDVNNWGSDSST